MELIDTTIYYFCGQNSRKQLFFLFMLESNKPLYLISEFKDWK